MSGTHVRPKHPTPPPPPSPPVVPPSPPPPPAAKLGSFGNASIDQWDSAFLAAVAAVKAKKGVAVNPLVMKAVMDVESGDNGNYPPDQCRSDGSCGPMQVKFPIHSWRCPDCNTKTVPGQIELATHIIGDTMKAQGVDEYGALLSTYFPADDTINGTTQKQYADKVRSLVATMSGTTPAPPPPPPPPVPVDVINAIVGGAPYTDDYGFKAPTDLPYYDYFVGHGGDSNQHTGIDVTGNIGEPLYSPISGTVVCAGTGIGAGAYGSSCAAFPYTLGANTGSSGRFEILADDGRRSLILGHVLRSLVPVGAKVQPGQRVAELGGMNGPHTHVEARIWSGGNYTIVDPRQAFGGGPIPVQRLPYDFSPEGQPNTFTVKALQPLKVYQRADPGAPVLDTIAQGESFQAVAVIPGNDGKPWYLGIHDGRVPVDGTDGPVKAA